MRCSKSSRVRRKRALFQQDIVTPHTARKTSNKFEKLDGIEVLALKSQPIVQTLLHLTAISFDQCSTLRKDRRFETFNEVKEAFQEFFDSKPKEWYFGLIQKVADCQQVLDNGWLLF